MYKCTCGKDYQEPEEALMCLGRDHQASYQELQETIDTLTETVEMLRETVSVGINALAWLPEDHGPIRQRVEITIHDMRKVLAATEKE